MTSEWVAAVAGAVLGVAGIASGHLIARGARVAAREIANAERRDAHLRWLREHRATAYVAILELAFLIGTYLEAARERGGRKSDLPALPEWSSHMRALAAVGAYGSKSVKTAVNEWNRFAGSLMDAIRKSPASAGETHSLEDRNREHELRRRLITMISKELMANDLLTSQPIPEPRDPESATADV